MKLNIILSKITPPDELKDHPEVVAWYEQCQKIVNETTVDAVEIPESERLSPAHYLAVRPDGLTFFDCLNEAANSPELVAGVDRLWGTNLQRRGTPIVLMVHDATGKADADKDTFLRFVWNYLFIRVPLAPRP